MNQQVVGLQQNTFVLIHVFLNLLKLPLEHISEHMNGDARNL